MSLRIIPVTLDAANDFVRRLHRHNKPVVGARFCIGVSCDGELVGVAIVGRPVAPKLDDGLGGSLHSLRHTYICHLLLAPVPIRTVQLYAGHAHITTTEKYAYQVLEMDPEAALRLSI